MTEQCEIFLSLTRVLPDSSAHGAISVCDLSPHCNFLDPSINLPHYRACPSYILSRLNRFETTTNPPCASRLPTPKGRDLLHPLPQPATTPRRGPPRRHLQYSQEDERPNSVLADTNGGRVRGDGMGDREVFMLLQLGCGVGADCVEQERILQLKTRKDGSRGGRSRDRNQHERLIGEGN